MVSSETTFEADEFDLMLLETLVRHPEMNYKDIAELLHWDQRTVAKRIRTLTNEGVLKQAVEIDWSKLGLRAQAYVGSTTVRGIGYAHKLNELINSDPRIVTCYETLGSNNYTMKVIETDMFKMRDSVLRDLDVLAAELTTSLVTKKLKQDYASLLRYLRETRFPRSRVHSDKVHKGPTQDLAAR
ncbi:MAG: Lrp/AsnC family transcriptional regulator [Thaumarchaeota archaeon]|nr:Lrp/AsnC family transcriptional regulator [Nitrososphaerota archaeon]